MAVGATGERLETFAETQVWLERYRCGALGQTLRVIEFALAAAQLFLARGKRRLQAQDIRLARGEARLERA